MTTTKPATPLPKDDWKCIPRAEYRKLLKDRARLVEALRGVELLARVNAPIFDGSPAHKSILALLAELGEEA